MFFLGARSFDRRSEKVILNARKLRRGAVTHVNSDGLIIARPRRHGLSFSLKGVALLVLAVWIFKILAIINLGGEAYAERLEGLAAGNQVQQATAWVMQPDPLSKEVVRYTILAKDMVRQIYQKVDL